MFSWPRTGTWRLPLSPSSEADGPDGLAATVRRADPDRYLCALYAPEDRRGDLLALYAFNAEIAAIRDRIREPMAGEVRMRWWRDALLSTEAGAAAGHPLASAMRATIERHRLPVQAIENYLEARLFDLYDDPMPSRNDLEGYCGETAGTILQLAALILDPAEAARHGGLAGHAACAQAIAGLIRLMPLHRARGQCYVPPEMLKAAGSSVERYLGGTDTGEGARVVSAMVALGGEHLGVFEGGAGQLPQSLRPAYLPVALASAYLDRAASRPAAALTAPVDISAVRRHWILLRRASRGWPKA